MRTDHALSPRPLRVMRMRRETPDTVTLHLDASKSGGLPFRPGQFTMVYAFGIGEVPISISGDPAKPAQLVHTVRSVGAVTEAICSARTGDWLGVRGPFGRGWPIDEARGGDLVLMGGGLGIAPLRPVIYEALARRSEFRRVMVLFGARTPEVLLFRTELDRWAQREDLIVRTTVDRATPDWHGRVGVVPALLDGLELDPPHTTALLCGPELMMQFAVHALKRRGIDDARIHLSMERNMKCAVGLCGHCQYGPQFICKDGPVLPFSSIEPRFWLKEV